MLEGEGTKVYLLQLLHLPAMSSCIFLITNDGSLYLTTRENMVLLVWVLLCFGSLCCSIIILTRETLFSFAAFYRLSAAS